MKIEFKDGREIEFKRFGKILLAESVIWQDTNLNGSIEELRKLKTKVAKWFSENAPEEISEKYNARLPLRKEIEPLPFKDAIAYREGGTDLVAEYFVGDEDCSSPYYCWVGRSFFGYGRIEFASWGTLDYGRAIRLCLEEKK